MKKPYIIAENLFTIAVADDLPAWVALRPRYDIFAATAERATEQPLLEITVRCEPLTKIDAERIYEPAYGGIDIVVGRARRTADGSSIMEFRHVAERRTRMRMTMNREMNRADITLRPDGDDNDLFFLTHALMIAYLLATVDNGSQLIHCSTILHEGRAYLFQGKSGTGKSTHSSLWLRHIPGAELLNDDHPVVRITPEGVARVYGTPWSGKNDCYHNVSAPVGAFVRIVRSQENELRQLAPLQAYASLTPSVFFLPFFTEEQRAVRHAVIERLAQTVPCCEMHCRPDADAALTCMRALKEL